MSAKSSAALVAMASPMRFSSMFVIPMDNRVEFYCSDYQTVDPDHEPIRWNLRDPQRQTLWGAPAPRSWFEEGSRFAGTEPRAPKLSATPISRRKSQTGMVNNSVTPTGALFRRLATSFALRYRPSWGRSSGVR